jgi:hypothetical protein
VTLPPLLAIDEPALSAIAPAPLASLSALNSTAWFCVVMAAALLMSPPTFTVRLPDAVPLPALAMVPASVALTPAPPSSVSGSLKVRPFTSMAPVPSARPMVMPEKPSLMLPLLPFQK